MLQQTSEYKASSWPTSTCSDHFQSVFKKSLPHFSLAYHSLKPVGLFCRDKWNFLLISHAWYVYAADSLKAFTAKIIRAFYLADNKTDRIASGGYFGWPLLWRAFVPYSGGIYSVGPQDLGRRPCTASYLTSTYIIYDQIVAGRLFYS